MVLANPIGDACPMSHAGHLATLTTLAKVYPTALAQRVMLAVLSLHKHTRTRMQHLHVCLCRLRHVHLITPFTCIPFMLGQHTKGCTNFTITCLKSEGCLFQFKIMSNMRSSHP